MEGSGYLVYGIVPADVEPTADARPIGDPAGELRTVQHRELAGLVSEIRLDQPLGRPADLTAYQELLDGTAAVAPVLPVRFGTVVTGPDAVADLLSAHYDRFRAALDELTDRIEYVVHGRYAEEALLRSVLAENREIGELAARVRGRSEAATRDDRIRLGEMISQAVELRREADNQRLLDAVSPVAVSTAVRPPSHEYDSVHAAFLIDVARTDEFVEAVEKLAADWRGQGRLRLLGPFAPYDFVDAHQLAG